MHMDPGGVEHEHTTGGQGGQARSPPPDAHCGTDVIVYSGERVSIAPHANDRSVTHRLGDLTRSHTFLEKRRAGEDRVTRSCTVHPSRFGAPIERSVSRGCVVVGRGLREHCGGGSRSGRHRRAGFTTPAGHWPTLRIDPREAPQQRGAGVMRMWDTRLDEMGSERVSREAASSRRTPAPDRPGRRGQAEWRGCSRVGPQAAGVVRRCTLREAARGRTTKRPALREEDGPFRSVGTTARRRRPSRRSS